MDDRPASPPEPMSRGIGMHGMRDAARALYGEAGMRAIAARLPEPTRRETMDQIVLPVSWYPVRFTLHWQDAIWDGPAARSDERFFQFVQRSIEQGFGRMRRFFLRLASVERMTARAPEMWRYQHTHGTLTSLVRGSTAQITLRDHPFVKDGLSRKATAEAWKHIVALSGRKGARSTFGVEGPDTLVVRISWND